VAPAACLAREQIGPGPFTAIRDARAVRLVDLSGTTVLVMADSYADLFQITGAPPGLLKGPRD
jgi:hypothetical protein